MIENVFGESEPASEFDLGRDAWARFLARMLDTQLFYALTMVIIYMAMIVDLKVGSLALSRFILHGGPERAWVGVPLAYAVNGVGEALCLSIWATTPGKALLGVSVWAAPGERLSFLMALRRWANVLVFGRAFDIPVLSFIIAWVCYTRFKRDGVTSWDEDLDIGVLRRQVIDWRWGAAIALIIGMFFFSYRAVTTATNIVLKATAKADIPRLVNVER
jgi:hypothetical protein